MKTPRSVSTIFGLAALITALSACSSAEGPTSLLEMAPVSPEVEPGANVQFTATSPVAPDERIAWAVLEPDGGTIDTAGVYTAPWSEGTYTISASLASLSATQTTQVQVKRNIRVDVSPSAATLAAGQSLALSANVTGAIKTVTWSVAEGSAGGTVTAAGVYTAPGTAGVYHVVATSTADPTKSGSATITVTAPPPPPPPPPTVTIDATPQSASVVAGNTVQFTATVTGSTNTGVTWSVAESGGGIVSVTGIYTAPLTAGTYHVLATSVADTSKTAAATVTVTSASTPIDPSWVDVTSFGARGDGVTDDTAAFQAATNTGKTVWVPRPPAFYKVTSPVQLRASIIGDSSDLGKMPMIRMFGSNGDGYHTTLVVRGYHGAQQLVIAGLQIDNQYVSGSYSGEWDHNITISDSDNVRVTTNRLLNAWGDGVCIGEWKRAPSNPELDCKNIIVENNYIHNPFRCTVAPLFTSGGSVIRNNYHRKINRSDNGTFIPPIDIEPDAGPQNSVVWDLLIEDNVVDTHTSDGANLHFIWQVTRFSYAPDPIHGTRARNNRGYWYALSNSGLAEDTNNVFMDSAPFWQMQPFSR